MRTFHVYTDASIKFHLGYYSICGIIVVDSHILDIYYKRRQKVPYSINSAERTAIRESVQYIIKKYKATNIRVYSDSINAMCKPFKKVKLIHVKAHTNKRNFKYRFNNLADYICDKGINNWKEYWNKTLLK